MVELAGGDEKDHSGCCRCIDGAKHRSYKEGAAIDCGYNMG